MAIGTLRRWLPVLLLAGCAPLHWTRPDASAEQAKKDEADCRQRAQAEALLRGMRYGPGRGAHRRDPIWSDPFFDEARLARFCMESRGYRLQSREKR